LYEVGFPSERAEAEFRKVLRKIPSKERQQIFDALERLAENPRSLGISFKFVKGALPIFGCLAQYRLRVGHGRVFYDVDDARRKVILLAIRRRREHTYD
jgi:mRNA-degrading endonuclease RelE of RelBE toxin-antitoxin system